MFTPCPVAGGLLQHSIASRITLDRAARDLLPYVETLPKCKAGKRRTPASEDRHRARLAVMFGFRITPARAIFASMAGHVVIRITERLGGGEPLRTAYAVAEPNQHRAVALFKLRPDHTADEQVEAVVELTQSALDSLGLKPGMIKPL